MQTFYFPFTDVTTAAARALHRCFGRFHILTTTEVASGQLNRLESDGLLKTICPHPEQDDAVRHTIGSVTGWGAALTEKDLRYFRMHTGDIPFFSDTSVSGIRSEIRSSASAGKREGGVDELLNAKVVLGLAEVLDRHRNELSEKLQGLENAEKDLQHWLSDDPREPGTPVGSVGRLDALPDPFALKLTERIQAWAVLALSAAGHLAVDPITLLATDCISVFEEMVELLGVEPVDIRRLTVDLDTAGIESGKSPLPETLAEWLTQSPPSEPDSGSVAAEAPPTGISAFRFSGEWPAALLVRLSGRRMPAPAFEASGRVWIAHLDVG
ncbi:MAG: hypothetical protein ACOWWM_21460 [Desulfobacterales bacterium]